jgi:hypothetical protein
MKALKVSFLKIRGGKNMKCPKCCQNVDKVWAIPDGESGRTIFGCWNCLHNNMTYFGYSRSQVIRYTKLAELNKDLEKEIEELGLCENDFEPNELILDDIEIHCRECGYNWPILKPCRIHNKDKCRKKHCPECGGHVTSERKQPWTHWYSGRTLDGTRCSYRVSETSANTIGP